MFTLDGPASSLRLLLYLSIRQSSARELNSSFTRAPSSTRALTRAYSTVVVGADERVGEKSKPTGFANHPPGQDRAQGCRIRGVRLVDRHPRGSLPGDKWITPNLLAHSRAQVPVSRSREYAYASRVREASPPPAGHVAKPRRGFSSSGIHLLCGENMGLPVCISLIVASCRFILFFQSLNTR